MLISVDLPAPFSPTMPWIALGDGEMDVAIGVDRAEALVDAAKFDGEHICAGRRRMVGRRFRSSHSRYCFRHGLLPCRLQEWPAPDAGPA
jgi:hypothetical protein